MLDIQNTKTLLIAEDDDALRERMARAMERRGFRTRTVATVADGMAQFEDDLPDYAIVDLRLLDGSGLSLVEELEKRNPNARAIILTGYGDIPTAVAAARIGAIDYIAKPATADEILDALNAPRDSHPPAPEDPMSPDDARWEHIARVFELSGGNVSHAARLLDMHRRTLQRTLRRHGVVNDAQG